MEPSNTLGLDFDQLKINDPPPSADAPAPAADQPADLPGDGESDRPAESKEKKKPYHNPERVKTGGSQRDKLTEEALSERMARMKEQNEKIKQRRLDVMADEDAFKKTQESERIKQAQNRKVQANVDRTREQNAKRKLDKIQSREWDSGKPAPTDWKKKADESSAPTERAAEGFEARGGGRGGHGRGRGRGGATRQTPVTSPTSDIPPTLDGAAAASSPPAATPVTAPSTETPA